MSNQLFSNNATTLLTSGINNSVTTLSVTTGTGSKFQSPTSPYYEMLTLSDGTNIEIVKCTGIPGQNQFTVVRAQEGTTAHSFLAGTKVEARITKGSLEELNKTGGTQLFARTDNGLHSILLTTSNGTCTGTYSLSLGYAALCSANGAIALGNSSAARIYGTFNHSGLSIIKQSESGAGGGWRILSGSQSIIASETTDLTTVLDFAVANDFPTGSLFFVDEVGLIITEATAITVAPQIAFGASGATTTDLLATVAAGLTAVNTRATFSPLTKNGLASVNASVKVAATGTSMSGRFYWKGFLLES